MGGTWFFVGRDDGTRIDDLVEVKQEVLGISKSCLVKPP